jgi:tryptophan 2,3-dioxygenase
VTDHFTRPTTAALGPLDEEARQRRAGATGGEPAMDAHPGRTPYAEYERIDELLALQQPRTNEPAEWTFYVLGQIMELIFKLLHHELVEVRDALLDDDMPGALHRLGRIGAVQQLLQSCWTPLETISPVEFNRFRDALGSASGLHSAMYRRLESVLGNKQPRLAALHEGTPDEAAVQSDLRSPSLWDAATRRLAEAGLAIEVRALSGDWAKPYKPEQSVEDAWTEVYRHPTDHPDLFQLGEALSTIAHNHHRWRAVHVLVAERILGDKPGTGATSGVAWLQRSAAHRIFPELLASRSRL